jgi:hypothetical protein
MSRQIKAALITALLAIIALIFITSMSSCSGSRNFTRSTSVCDDVKNNFVGYK